MTVCEEPPLMSFRVVLETVLTILISTEFNVLALPFCKPYCFESEIPYCPPLKVPLLVFEKPLQHVLSGFNSLIVLSIKFDPFFASMGVPGKKLHLVRRKGLCR